MAELNRTIQTVGIDVGMAHGAVVQLDWEIRPKDIHLTGAEVLVQYDRKTIGVNFKTAEPLELSGLAAQILKPWAASDPFFSAIDFSFQAANWKANRMQMMKTGFFMGSLFTQLESWGITYGVFSPTEVRGVIADYLKPTAPKEWVANLFRSKFGKLPIFEPGVSRATTKDDVIDAAILSYVGLHHVLAGLPVEVPNEYTSSFSLSR